MFLDSGEQVQIRWADVVSIMVMRILLLKVQDYLAGYFWVVI